MKFSKSKKCIISGDSKQVLFSAKKVHLFRQKVHFLPKSIFFYARKCVFTQKSTFLAPKLFYAKKCGVKCGFKLCQIPLLKLYLKFCFLFWNFKNNIRQKMFLSKYLPSHYETFNNIIKFRIIWTKKYIFFWEFSGFFFWKKIISQK